MADESRVNSNDESLISITVEGLRKRDDIEQERTKYTEQIQIPKEAPISQLWTELESLGYECPGQLTQGEKAYTPGSKKACLHPCETIEVVDDRPSEDGKFININDPLISFTNRALKRKIDLGIGGTESRLGSREMSSLRNGDDLKIEFHRTTRMPDDERLHQLPASVGIFPLYNVSEYVDKLPDNIANQGGVFLPMWQREALWINFGADNDEYALRVFVGRINAVSGRNMDESGNESSETEEPIQDYVVVPAQKWLDGICVAPGVVRQFVAMPLSAGYTVEGQKTGEEKYGGLQIEIIPAYKTGLKIWLPELTAEETMRSISFRRHTLNEQSTPFELGLSPGTRIREFPPNPTYFTENKIFDLAECSAGEETKVEAIYFATYHPDGPLNRFPPPKPLMVDSGLGASPSPYAAPNLRHSIPYKPRAGYDCAAASPRNQPKVSYKPSIVHGKVEHEPRMSHTKGRPHDFRRDSHSSPRPVPGYLDRGRRGPDFKFEPRLATKDLKAMGIAAGGKLVQDIYKDGNPARIWNTEATRLVHVHILDPASCEKVTHIVPPPPPIDTKEYIDQGKPFFVIEEQTDNRVDGGDFNDIASVSAKDKEKGVTTETFFDPSKPKMCKECETRLCDCLIRPCGHQFCNICIKKLENDDENSSRQQTRHWKCPACHVDVSHVAGFSAPMNLPGEEALKAKVPVQVLKVEDGRIGFKSIQRTRI